MISFKLIKFKNFQSVGNQFVEIYLDRSPTTLISGLNGSGKSNVLEAITYSAFGKSLKKVVLADLVNTINKKNLLTELEFETNGHEYKIVRGEKPKKLEFYRDNEQLLQEASAADTQAQIEFVLGFDYKTYCQMIVINKERYIPFMDQNPATRRKVIEDILDIGVISVAADINKSKISEIKRVLSTYEYERAKLIERKNGVSRLIQQQSESNKSQISQLQDEIIGFEEKIKEKESQKALLVSNLDDLENGDVSELREKVTKLTKFKTVFETKVSSAKTVISFFEKNDVCSTCGQDIDSHFKENIITENTSIVDEHNKNILSARTKIEKVNEKITLDEEKTNLVRDTKSKISVLTQTISGIGSQIEINRKKITKLQFVDNTLDTELEELNKKCLDIETKYMDEDDKLKQHTELLNHFKDTGVKAMIVSEYIDFINKKINEYLKAMEFWCVVKLDENFDETISVGQREKVSYDSFSTGQKSRLNLAIFMALTEVANIKNSVSANIMMLDEILENIDATGIEMIMKLFNNVLKTKNIFVITQRSEEFSEFFRSEIKFELNKNDFSEIQN